MQGTKKEHLKLLMRRGFVNLAIKSAKTETWVNYNMFLCLRSNDFSRYEVFKTSELSKEFDETFFNKLNESDREDVLEFCRGLYSDKINQNLNKQRLKKLLSANFIEILEAKATRQVFAVYDEVSSTRHYIATKLDIYEQSELDF